MEENGREREKRAIKHTPATILQAPKESTPPSDAGGTRERKVPEENGLETNVNMALPE